MQKLVQHNHVVEFVKLPLLQQKHLLQLDLKVLNDDDDDGIVQHLIELDDDVILLGRMLQLQVDGQLVEAVQVNKMET